ncbi:hypothetical protein TNCV_3504561 [Trichonephila clavipes]|uniref:Uncharacterized protein n=1 Tax=Trichonephila clavipes TaxID=2585209 RepID=A0A8X6RXN0_TRICX|nr:hypothetical protein TNCV_3504561 [Trichonephila clavipes]
MSWVQAPELLTAHRVEGLMQVKSVVAESPVVGVVWNFSRRVNRKRFAFLSLQLVCIEHSGRHLSGHENTHNARICGLENHEVLESQRDSSKVNGFVPFLGGNCTDLSLSENQL